VSTWRRDANTGEVHNESQPDSFCHRRVGGDIVNAPVGRAQEPVAGQRGAGGGRGGAQAAPQNLQVLPKEMTQAQVLQTMQQFAGALGVQCGYCHVQAAAAPGGRGDGGAVAAEAPPRRRSISRPMTSRRRKSRAR